MSVTLESNEIAFIAARVRRLCKAFDYPIPDKRDDEFIVRVAGSLIGGVLLKIKMQEPVARPDGGHTPLIPKPTEPPKGRD